MRTFKFTTGPPSPIPSLLTGDPQSPHGDDAKEAQPAAVQEDVGREPDLQHSKG
jgi:hypothetical protein